MKKLFALVCMMSMLCGCAAVSTVNINEDLSGDVTAFTGMDKEMYESQNPDTPLPTDTYTRDGVTYYGETEKESFANINEMYGEGEGFKITNPEKGKYVASYTPGEAQGDMTIEQMQMLTDKLLMEVTMNFPTPMKQTVGPIEGIEINGNQIVFDATKIDENAPYTFKSGTFVFRDARDTDWFNEAVVALSNDNILTGDGTGKFNPKDHVTTGQLCQILVKYNKLPTGADETGYWAAKAIQSCKDAGYILEPITGEEDAAREMAATAILLACTEARDPADAGIPDIDKVSDQYKQYVPIAYAMGIVRGVDDAGTFAPMKSLSRAEVCQMLFNLK